MGKRFTATEIWDKIWFRKLPPRLKALWSYLKDRCDCAGVWDPDFETASYHIGESVEEKDMVNFGDRVQQLSSGKWWLRHFIRFQYGALSHDCHPHRAVFQSIDRNGLNLELRKVSVRVSKGLAKGKLTLQDKDQDKDKEKDMDKDQEKDKDRISDFEIFWSAYPKKQGKAEAQKAWRQTAKDRPLTAEVVSAVERGKHSEQWSKDGGQFIPHPATWLRRHGWLDEYKTHRRIPKNLQGLADWLEHSQIKEATADAEK